MARERLSEYRTKMLLAAALKQTYTGHELDADEGWQSIIDQLEPAARFVVKVDQGVKRRFKQGLVALNVPAAKVQETAAGFFARGFRYCLVEPFTEHAAVTEQYLAVRYTRAGNMMLFGTIGGVDVNEHSTEITQAELSPASVRTAEQVLDLATGTLDRLQTVVNDNHITLLELNPLLVQNGRLVALDAAAEVDATAEHLVAGRWTSVDLRHSVRTPEEAAVEELSAHSPASFNLKALNPNGQIFVLLSGGGASLVITDEFCHQGLGPQLGNYGEYSGDPSESEVADYVQQVLSLLKKSKAAGKVLVIGGGVANFTDVRATFKGIIRALDGAQAGLRRDGVKVYVRRGGPHGAEGLALMRAFLEQAGLLGLVAGPELNLAELVKVVTADLKAPAAT